MEEFKLPDTTMRSVLPYNKDIFVLAEHLTLLYDYVVDLTFFVDLPFCCQLQFGKEVFMLACSEFAVALL